MELENCRLLFLPLVFIPGPVQGGVSRSEPKQEMLQWV